MSSTVITAERVSGDRRDVALKNTVQFGKMDKTILLGSALLAVLMSMSAVAVQAYGAGCATRQVAVSLEM